MYNLLYDGSFEGFLTAVYHVLHQPVLELKIQRQDGFHDDSCSQDIIIPAGRLKAMEMRRMLEHFLPGLAIAKMRTYIEQGPLDAEEELLEYIKKLAAHSSSDGRLPLPLLSV